MKKFLKSKKGIALLAMMIVAVAAAVGAYAYWTTTGAGTGTVANASANGELVLHADWAADALYPGGSQDVSFTADNASDTNLYVGTITTDSITTSDPGCLPADFSIDPVVSNTIVPAGETGYALDGTGTLSFANSIVSQDDCKGAEITLHLSSN
jgi:hypothetical protein